MITPTHGNAPQSPQSAALPWMTIHRCPTCGSENVRRSTVRERERDVGEHKFHSPYRCRACNERFWVVSRKARTAATVAAVACGVGLVLLVALVVVSFSDDDTADLSSATTEEAAPPADETAPPVPALQDPLRATDLPPPTTRPPAPASSTKFDTQPLRPPAQPFVK